MSFTIMTFQTLGLIAQWSGLIVVSAIDPVHRVALQIIVFQAGAFIYTILDYYFLGLTYIIVYVGAIAILFQFVIMMVQINSTDTNIIDKRNYELPLIITSDHSRTQTLENAKHHKQTQNTTIGFDTKFILNIISSDKNLYNSSGVPFSTQDSNTLTIDSIGTKRNSNVTYNYNIQTTQISPLILIQGGILQFQIGSIINFFRADSPIYTFELINSTTTYIGHSQFSMTPIVTYFYPSWAVEYQTMTDIQTLAYIVYLAYPLALIQIGIAQWAVMIGIIAVTSRN